MAFLKAVKDSFCFISRDTRSQILGLKYDMASVPSNTDFTRGLLTQTDNVEGNLRKNYIWKYLQIPLVQFL